MNVREQELLAALKTSPFVQEIPDGEIKPDYAMANVPRLTLTLVIRKDKSL
jgi:hypothetical protein